MTEIHEPVNEAILHINTSVDTLIDRNESKESVNLKNVKSATSIKEYYKDSFGKRYLR